MLVNRINKILLIFLFMLALVIAGIWNYLQSERFGSLLSQKLSEQIKKTIDADIAFERADIQLFPPGANIYNVEASHRTEDIEFSVKVSQLGIYFKVFDFFKNKVSIKELFFTDGYITLNTLSQREYLLEKMAGKGSDSEELKIPNILNLYQEYVESLPIFLESVNLTSLQLNAGDSKAWVDKLLISKSTFQWLALKAVLKHFKIKNISPDIPSEELDSFELDLQVKNDQITVRELKILKDMESISMDFDWKNYEDIKNSQLRGHYNGLLELNVINRIWPDQTIAKITDGTTLLSGAVIYENQKFKITNHAEIKKAKTNFISGDEVVINSEFKDNKITIIDFNFQHHYQELKLLRPVMIYDFEKKDLLPNTITVNAVDLDFNNALSFTDDTLDMIKGKINGTVLFDLIQENDETSFRFRTGLKTSLDDFRLAFDSDSEKIKKELVLLANPKINFQKGDFLIRDGKVELGIKIDFGNSNLKIDGSVVGQDLKFVGSTDLIQLSDLGKIATMDIAGFGQGSFSVLGTIDKAVLNTKLNLEDTEFIGFKLANSDIDFDLNFANNLLTFNKINGIQGKTPYRGFGTFDYKTMDMNIDIQIPTIFYKDFLKLHEPLVEDLSYLPSQVTGAMNANYQLRGKGNLKEMIVLGNMTGKSILIEGEPFDDISVDLIFKNQAAHFKNILLTKNRSRIVGDFRFDLQDTIAHFWFTLKGQNRLKDWVYYKNQMLGLDGNLSADIKGVRVGDDYNMKGQLKVSDSSVAGQSIDDSILTFKIMDQKIDYDLSYMGDYVLSNGFLSFKSSGTMLDRSFMETTFNIKDFSVLVRSLVDIDLSQDEIKGAFKGDLYSDFNLNDLSSINLSLNIGLFSFIKENMIIDNAKKSQFVTIRNGNIENWNLEFLGQNGLFRSKGIGHFNGQYEVVTNFDFDANVLEILHPRITEAKGLIKNEIVFRNFLGVDELYILSESKDIFANIEGMRTTLQKGSFKSQYKNGRLDLSYLNAELESGKVVANGEIFFDENINVNINYQLSEANFKIQDRTNTVVSGQGAILGNKLPYTITGDLILNKTLVFNEPEDFKDDSSSILKQIRFLPPKVKDLRNTFFLVDLNITTSSPVIIKNSMLEMGLVGDIMAKGDPLNPSVSGKLNLVQGFGKAFFKNNEFNLISGNIYFLDTKLYTNPEVDFVAMTKINEYQVRVRYYGDLDNASLELSSEPFLPQNEVLSLIAFGYTENVSQGMTDADKTSLSVGGVGSFIFDQFKINETLKNQLGLQLNMGTEIDTTQDSLLNPRGGDGGGIGRVRTGTKIELRKKINQEMDLSFSSTVSGSIRQRQRMNLNYNVNNNVSIQGVYEIPSEDQTEQDFVNQSVGADIKLRWNFK